MGIGMLLFWGLVIVAIVMLVRCSRDSGICGKPERSDSALDILK